MITSWTFVLVSRWCNRIATRAQGAEVAVRCVAQLPVTVMRMSRALMRSAVVLPVALIVLILFALAIAIEAINQTRDLRRNTVARWKLRFGRSTPPVSRDRTRGWTS